MRETQVSTFKRRASTTAIMVLNFTPGGSINVVLEIPECNSTVKISIQTDRGYYVCGFASFYYYV